MRLSPRTFLTISLRTFMAGIYRATLNPISGRMEWVLEDETYDFYQEIARSGYADMLHDTERNVLYHQAIKNVIAEFRKRDEPVRVLDIGTGTGLLSMMAAAAGADKVSACEAFLPMAETAKKIIASNGYEDKVTLIEKRSTDMTEGDMIPGRANVAVAEVFDTELIGEGALRTFKEAHERLLKENARVIPAKATIYAQVISSEVVHKWAQIRPISYRNRTGELICTIKPSESCLGCPGNNSVHDLQLDQLSPSEFTILSEPVTIFRFDFERPNALHYNEYETLEVTSSADSVAHAIFMWWDLDMDGSGQLILSTKPNWENPGKNQWRDHWMQAIYHLPKPVALSKGASFWLIGCHDEHSLWFDIKTKPQDIPRDPFPAPICECGVHAACSRGNIGRLNDESTYKVLPVLEKIVSNKICLCISDCSLFTLFAVKFGSKKVYALQNGNMYRKILSDFAEANEVQFGKDLVLISDLNELPIEEKIDCVFGDPFFFAALLPWHNLHFWYKVTEARRRGHLTENCHILPQAAHIKAVALETKDLWKIRAPVKTVDGFDLRIFDNIVQKATEICDAIVEPHPLWEYPSTALSRDVHLATYDFDEDVPTEEILSNAKLKLEWPGKLNAIAFWVDWHFKDRHVGSHVTSGCTNGCNPGQQPNWNRYTRQGVYFLRQPFHEVKGGQDKSLDIETVFDGKSGDVKFNVKLCE